MDNENIKKQMLLYFIFAVCMILLNYTIQKTNQIVFYPIICDNYNTIEIIQALYCSKSPFNMAELMGSIIAVGITYIVKFFLDKYIVFKKKGSQLKETSIEFVKYFLFAVLTTIENIGIQFILTNFLGSPLEISFVIALSIGYITKFFLDKKYVFNREYEN
jgi:putative flippase GtrA